jgi:hypothetical protein
MALPFYLTAVKKKSTLLQLDSKICTANFEPLFALTRSFPFVPALTIVFCHTSFDTYLFRNKDELSKEKLEGVRVVIFGGSTEKLEPHEVCNACNLFFSSRHIFTGKILFSANHCVGSCEMVAVF